MSPKETADNLSVRKNVLETQPEPILKIIEDIEEELLKLGITRASLLKRDAANPRRFVVQCRYLELAMRDNSALQQNPNKELIDKLHFIRDHVQFHANALQELVAANDPIKHAEAWGVRLNAITAKAMEDKGFAQEGVTLKFDPTYTGIFLRQCRQKQAAINDIVRVLEAHADLLYPNLAGMLLTMAVACVDAGKPVHFGPLLGLLQAKVQMLDEVHTGQLLTLANKAALPRDAAPLLALMRDGRTLKIERNLLHQILDLALRFSGNIDAEALLDLLAQRKTVRCDSKHMSQLILYFKQKTMLSSDIKKTLAKLVYEKGPRVSSEHRDALQRLGIDMSGFE